MKPINQAIKISNREKNAKKNKNPKNSIQTLKQSNRTEQVSIQARTPPTPTTFTHNKLPLLHVRFRHSTDTGRLIIGLFGVDTLQTAELFIAWFFPLGNESTISVLFPDEPVVQFPADFLLVVKFVVDES